VTAKPAVDRAARDRAADLLERYLREEIGAFELDEGLQKIQFGGRTAISHCGITR
jgi:hypothetical protein